MYQISACFSHLFNRLDMVFNNIVEKVSNSVENVLINDSSCSDLSESIITRTRKYYKTLGNILWV